MQQQDHILNYFNMSNMIILLPMVMIAHFMADDGNDYDDSDVRWIASESCVPGRYSVGLTLDRWMPWFMTCNLLGEKIGHDIHMNPSGTNFLTTLMRSEAWPLQPQRGSEICKLLPQ